MLPETRYSHPVNSAAASPKGNARAVALELLQDFALPEACNIETWFDRIETRAMRELRP